MVEADSYLLSLTRYIHRNPIETRRPLVAALEDYPWSSYPAYLNLAKSPEWLFRAFTYAALGRRDRFRGYRQFVEQGVDEELAAFYGGQRQAPILGSDHFREELLRSSTVDSDEVASSELAAQASVAPGAVVEAVSQVFGVAPARITARSLPGRAGHNPARAMAMWFCQDCAEMTLPDIGRLFGGVHYSAVGQAVRRIKERVAVDSELRGLAEAIRDRLAAARSSGLQTTRAFDTAVAE